MTARSHSWKGVALLMFLAACEEATAGLSAESLGAPLVAADSEACTRVLEAKAEVRDVPGGVVLELRSPGTPLDVVSLRDYMGHLADAWNQAERGIMRACFESDREPRGWSADDFAPSTVALESIDEGVRVIFRPLDRAQLYALRAYVWRRQQRALACVCEPTGP